MLNQYSAPGGAVLLRLLLASWAASAFLMSCTNAIGVNFGQVASNIPSTDIVLQLVKSTSISKLKIYNADPEVLTTFAGSGIDIVIAADNDQVQPLAQTEGYALQWVQNNIAAYVNTTIVGIALGNEVLSYQLQLIPFLLPALQNLQAALVSLRLDKTVKISSPNSLGIVAKSFPPSYGEFHYQNGDIMSPLLDFYAQTGSPFMVNIYPYFAYTSSPENISLDYVLFGPNAVPVYDDGSGLNYTNMFDAQVDAVYAAISKLGYDNITVAVTETGWPSAGDPTETGANVENAQLFNANLVQHIESGVGTPARPGVTVDTYIFALYNEDMKTGPTSERNFGLFSPDGTPVYNSGLSVSPQWYSPPPSFWSPPPPTIGALPPVVSWPPPPVAVVPPVVSWPPPPVPVVPPVGHPPPPVTVVPPVSQWYPPPVTVVPPVSQWYPPPVTVVPPVSQWYPPPATVVPPVSQWYPPPVTVVPPVGQWSPPPLPLPLPPQEWASPPPAPALGWSPPPPPALGWSPPPATIGSSPPPATIGSSPPPILPTPTAPTVPIVPGPGGTSWCVAKADADPGQLQIALDWACSTAGTDCTALQTGGACFEPNTVIAHASYAFNSYYEHNGRNAWDCFFSDTAVVTAVDPSFSGCTFP